MIRNYLEKIKQYLYNKEILPIIKKNKGYYSLDEIVEAMKPVLYENIKGKLPIEFAKTMRLISKKEDQIFLN